MKYESLTTDGSVRAWAEGVDVHVEVFHGTQLDRVEVLTPAVRTAVPDLLARHYFLVTTPLLV